MSTFPQLLERRLRTDAGRPFVTFYDDATGERTELSMTTYANWVAKFASLLVEEFDLERGAVMLVDLPTHWLGPVALGAAWSAGIEVVTDHNDERISLVFCGPDELADHLGRAPGTLLLASALSPLGQRFPPGTLPDGVHDLGVEIWSQPDSFFAADPPDEHDLAWSGQTQADLFSLSAAAPGPGGSGGNRILAETILQRGRGIATVTSALMTGGSMVLVRRVSAERRAEIAITERVTDVS